MRIAAKIRWARLLRAPACEPNDRAATLAAVCDQMQDTQFTSTLRPHHSRTRRQTCGKGREMKEKRRGREVQEISRDFSWQSQNKPAARANARADESNHERKEEKVNVNGLKVWLGGRGDRKRSSGCAHRAAPSPQSVAEPVG